ncbi:hypothetical protein [Paenibacillus polymyxa]|uniref:hypothetical protein n=1 Tax=Paenibacillus polymyxa TaxID=1406 RepID=UPI00058A0C07|nr:hypothetical protein [Paenibacillus polymyxa]AJE51450.1 hypothetical protein RE92_10560 [Paenibacillus polymyxa]QOH60136.1 hypothetical protein DI243_01150 [Paenibacillus polymyxa]
MDINNLKKQVELFWKSKGYIYVDSKGLISSNPDLLFNNSSTRVFFDTLKKGRSIESNSFTIQPCLKNHNLKLFDSIMKEKRNIEYLSFFHGFGTFQKGKINLTFLRIVIQFIEIVIRIKSNNVYVIIPNKFSNFKNCLDKFNILVSSKEELTNWNCGLENIQGDSINFLVKLKNGNIIQFCDIVEIYDSITGETYIEYCASLEFILMLRENYLSPIECNTIYSSINDLLNEPIQKEIFLDCFISVLEIIKDIYTNSNDSLNWQHTHKLRKYIKYILFITENNDIDQSRLLHLAEEYLKNKSCLDELKELLENQKLSINRNVKAYKKFLKESKIINTSELYDIGRTRYGLIEKKIQAILDE